MQASSIRTPTVSAEPGVDDVLRTDLFTPMAIRVAATLRIADHVGAGRSTAEAIAEATDLRADRLERLLAHLATVGALAHDGTSYRLTAAGERLRDEHPDGLRRRLDIEGGLGRGDLAAVELLAAIRDEAVAYERRYGSGFWADLEADPSRREAFDAAMSHDVADWHARLADALAWDRFDDVVDVGGGDGTLLAALLADHPTMRGRVLDLPGSAAAAADVLSAPALGGRGSFVAGSFFDPLPPGADAYVLSGILHDWPDEDAERILSRCREAAGSTGTILVIERTGAGGEEPSTEMDLRLLVVFDGRERGVAALGTIAARAGLRIVAVHPAGVLSVIELGDARDGAGNDR